VTHKNRSIKLVILFALSFNVCSAGIFEIASGIGLGAFYTETLMRIITYRAEAQSRLNAKKAASEQQAFEYKVKSIRSIISDKISYTDVLDAEPIKITELIENFIHTHPALSSRETAHSIIKSKEFLALREHVVDENHRNRLQRDLDAFRMPAQKSSERDIAHIVELVINKLHAIQSSVAIHGTASAATNSRSASAGADIKVVAEGAQSGSLAGRILYLEQRSAAHEHSLVNLKPEILTPQITAIVTRVVEANAQLTPDAIVAKVMPQVVSELDKYVTQTQHTASQDALERKLAAETAAREKLTSQVAALTAHNQQAAVQKADRKRAKELEKTAAAASQAQQNAAQERARTQELDSINLTIRGIQADLLDLTTEQKRAAESTAANGVAQASKASAPQAAQSDDAVQAHIKKLTTQLAELQTAQTALNSSVDERLGKLQKEAAERMQDHNDNDNAHTAAFVASQQATATELATAIKRLDAELETLKKANSAKTASESQQASAAQSAEIDAQIRLGIESHLTAERITQLISSSQLFDEFHKANATKINALEALIKQMGEQSSAALTGAVTAFTESQSAAATARTELQQQLTTLRTELQRDETQFKALFDKYIAEFEATRKQSAAAAAPAPQPKPSPATAAASAEVAAPAPIDELQALGKRIAGIELQLSATPVATPAAKPADQDDALRKELATLKQQFAEMQQRSEQFVTQNLLRDRTIGYSIDLKMHHQKLEQLTKDFMEGQRSRVTQVLQPIEAYRDTLNAMESKLTKQIESLRTERTAQESAFNAALAKQNSEATLALSAAQDAQRKESAASLDAKEKALATQIAENRRLIDTLTSAHATLSTDHTALKRKQGEQHARLAKDRDTATEERAKLRTELDALKASHSPSHVAQLMAQTSERLTAAKAEIKSDLEQNKAKLKEELGAELKAGLEAQAKKLAAEKAEEAAAQEKSRTEREEAQNKEIREELANIETRFADANKAQLDAFAKRLDEIQAHAAQQTAAANNTAITQALEALRKQIAAETDARTELEGTVEGHTTQISDLDTRVTNNTDVLTRLTGRVKLCEEHQAAQVKLNEEFVKRTELAQFQDKLGGLELFRTNIMARFEAHDAKLKQETEERQAQALALDSRIAANTSLLDGLPDQYASKADFKSNVERIGTEQEKQDREIADLTRNFQAYNQIHTRMAQVLDAAQASGGRTTECPHCVIAKLAKTADANMLKDMRVPLDDREAELLRKSKSTPAKTPNSKGTGRATPLRVSPASTPGSSRHGSRRSSIAGAASPVDAKASAERKAGTAAGHSGSGSKKSAPLTCATHTHSAAAAASGKATNAESSGSSTSSPALSPAASDSGTETMFSFGKPNSGHARAASCADDSTFGRPLTPTRLDQHSVSAPASTTAKVGMGFGSLTNLESQSVGKSIASAAAAARRSPAPFGSLNPHDAQNLQQQIQHAIAGGSGDAAAGSTHVWAQPLAPAPLAIGSTSPSASPISGNGSATGIQILSLDGSIAAHHQEATTQSPLSAELKPNNLSASGASLSPAPAANTVKSAASLLAAASASAKEDDEAALRLHGPRTPQTDRKAGAAASGAAGAKLKSKVVVPKQSTILNPPTGAGRGTTAGRGRGAPTVRGRGMAFGSNTQRAAHSAGEANAAKSKAKTTNTTSSH
jgi:hypothetical protein